MAQRPVAYIDGATELRKSLSKLERADFRDALKKGADIVARQARVNAPKRSGRLAASVKPTTSGARAVIRSRLPYANVIHWGGNVPSRRSRSTRPPRSFPRRPFITDAFAQRGDQAVRVIGDEIERRFSRGR